MFLGDRLPIVQKLILTEDEAEEQEALEELHQVQLKDFEEILEAMDGYDVTVRLLDPPLHEFLPSLEELLIAEAKDELDDEGQVLLAAARAWSEENPMLGVRGVRLGVLRPRIYRMQVQSLAEAAIRRVEAGGDPRPEIMIPLVTGRKELAHALKDAKEVIAEVEEKTGKQVPHKLGAMIETPRAALRANEMAEIADFFSFGTNDLTQLTFGFSRDDVEGRMMPVYLEENILPYSPFRTIDFDGVGELVTIAVERARSTKENIILGICGEHGGDPKSVHFCHRAGLDYVSCSPFRVPIARLAAAQAAILGE
jgi:pyruvate,orthophosphate dikinase